MENVVFLGYDNGDFVGYVNKPSSGQVDTNWDSMQFVNRGLIIN